MNWTKVVSSLISEIGYDEDAQELGVRFPVNKFNLHSVPEGQTWGSEYHYQNVPSRVYRALMSAESIGGYFRGIKGNPDAYPFEKISYPTQPVGKVEADAMPDPTERTQTPKPRSGNGNISTSPETTTEPSSALAMIDTMADELLFTPGAITDAQLAAGREWYLTEAKKYNISTEDNRTKLKRFARTLQKLRTGIEARAKEITGATKRKISVIDAEKRRLVAIVGGIEVEVLAPLTTWENIEESRVQAHTDAIAAIKEGLGYGATEGVEELTNRLKWLDGQLSRDWQEFQAVAEHTIEDETVRTRSLLDIAVSRDRERAELESLRAESAKHADQERIDFFAKEAKVEAERQAAANVAAAEQRAKDAEARAKAAEEQARIDAEDAERRAIATESKRLADQEAAVEAERQRAAAEVARIERESQTRAADEVNRAKINGEAILALQKSTCIGETDASVIVQAIAKGLIPHVSIAY